ncbi:MAG: hypothetical protein WAV09_03220 [Minisyncoccia bacterium]
MKISEDVRQVLERGVVIDGSYLRITQKLDRVLYMKVAKTLDALGAKWERRVQSHVSDPELGSRIEQALVQGEVTTDRDLGFFATPRKLAEQMAEWVCPVPGLSVLEPSAGSGALADAATARGAKVTCIEYYGQRATTLANRWRYTLNADFMDYTALIPYQGIIANPPFCKVGLGDHLDHLTRMLTMLAPGGRLACVMPASLIFREDRRYAEMRRALGAAGAKIEPLPEGTFKESGTLVNTCLVKLAKAA